MVSLHSGARADRRRDGAAGGGRSGAARAAGCARLWLVTTNDNLDALGFYQRRGLRLSRSAPGAVDDARRTLKPEIPETGDGDIPIRDELELEMRLDG